MLKLGIINIKFHHSAYKFCFVRNPYEGAISLFNYLSMTGHIKGIDFEKFLDKVYLNKPLIVIYNHLGLNQTNPQTDWILDTNENFLVNKIFKIEGRSYG